MKVEKNTWVKIHDIVLTPNERAPQVPADTKKVPLELWTKGFLLKDGIVGETVEISTITGRIVAGTLVEVHPYYDHDFGKSFPELLEIGIQLKEILWGGEENE
ncbi:hypothetical protein SAMN05660297_00425 [Natronincola peptidivorans]|uniref:2-amino-4-ketopentanoate thiolase alpha subunit n=1 Tax=Natronincola peptidivorans TaxID=426128 RepID=A0A1H9YVB2_9FIRM|nr:2-amino-4-oxopentanoate thiolase subunit OrtA [Natronincola peptidivorans]SES73111.1 hypothetical protein SAMN05660297_00425 [Natronincola peptidivorans]